jgi:hypothetical protein
MIGMIRLAHLLDGLFDLLVALSTDISLAHLQGGRFDLLVALSTGDRHDWSRSLL